MPRAGLSPVPFAFRLPSRRAGPGEGQSRNWNQGFASRPWSLYLFKQFLVLRLSCVERDNSPPAQWGDAEAQVESSVEGVELAPAPAFLSLGRQEPQQVWGQPPLSPWPDPEVGPNTLGPSLSREPVVPPGGDAQLPAGLQLGARVQQRVPSVRGAPGPGLGARGGGVRGGGRRRTLALGAWGAPGSCSGLPAVIPAVPPELGAGPSPGLCSRSGLSPTRSRGATA